MQNALVAWLLFATLLQTTAIAQQAHSKQQLSSQDLQQQLLSEEVTELTTDKGSFLTLQRQALTSYTKGTAILVPDWHEHAASPDFINPLRQQMNEYGWHTLAVMPPDILLTEPSANEADYQQQLVQRLNAAIRQADSQANLIVIAKGSSAALLNQLFATEQLPAPAAFVMLGAYLADVKLNRELANHIASQSVPTLDISHQRDNRFVSANLQLRQQLVNRNLKTQYRQRQLTGTFYDADTHAWVLKEITGWLHSIGL
ncbi:DUF3530 family protein [Arsukibacterium indicum]|nr:DUF3530 family protein [Arsukibacterium indicum]